MIDSTVVNGAFLKSMSPTMLRYWIQMHRLNLAGGACFVRNSSWISKTIQSLTKKYAQSDFVPSHVGSLVLIGSDVHLFDMIPPQGRIQTLFDYIYGTNDEFVLVLRGDNFKLDVTAFSQDIFRRIGKSYGYFSALQCALKNIDWIPNRKEHCSEIHSLELQKQGYFKGVKCDDETPVEVYDKLIAGVV